MTRDEWGRNALLESILAEPPPPPPAFTPRRPQLIAEGGELVWAGRDVEVILSPGDPNWSPDRGVISIVRAWR